MSSDHYRVRFARRAKRDLRRIGKRYGKKTYETIRDLIQGLESEPEKKGEPLTGPLRGLYSRHYSRFRIVFQIDKQGLVVLVVGTGYHETGSTSDIYKLFKRALGSGTLFLQDEDSSSVDDDD